MPLKITYLPELKFGPCVGPIESKQNGMNASQGSTWASGELCLHEQAQTVPDSFACLLGHLALEEHALVRIEADHVLRKGGQLHPLRPPRDFHSSFPCLSLRSQVGLRRGVSESTSVMDGDFPPIMSLCVPGWRRSCLVQEVAVLLKLPPPAVPTCARNPRSPSPAPFSSALRAPVL